MYFLPAIVIPLIAAIAATRRREQLRLDGRVHAAIVAIISIVIFYLIAFNERLLPEDLPGSIRILLLLASAFLTPVVSSRLLDRLFWRILGSKTPNAS